MQRKMIGRRRAGTSALAVLLVIALLLTGTFAWTSINQQALNPAHGWDRYEEVPLIAGGRLHDHFEVVSEWEVDTPANKDVFVENFREDGEDIFARIRLTEFMMINEVSLIPGAFYDDLTSWTPRLTSPTTSNVLTDFWHWETGGRTNYIPTFNRDPQSRETDTRGAAIDPQWTTQGIGADLGAVSSLSTRRAVDLNWPSVTPPANSATWQPFPAEAGGENGTSWTGASHNAAVHNGTTFLAPTTVTQRTNMPNATGVMTYAAWSQLAEDDQVGPFWVVDPAGWAYWMLPIPAQTSTGLLLDAIALRTDTVGANTLVASEDTPEIDWWYGIHVTAEMSLYDNWNLWDTEGAGMTPEGVRIMTRATRPVPPDFVVDVDVDEDSNVTITVTPDDNYDVSVEDGNILVTLPDADTDDEIQVNLPPGWTYTPGRDDEDNVIITITPPPGQTVEEYPPGSGNIVVRGRMLTITGPTTVEVGNTIFLDANVALVPLSGDPAIVWSISPSHAAFTSAGYAEGDARFAPAVLGNVTHTVRAELASDSAVFATHTITVTEPQIITSTVTFDPAGGTHAGGGALTQQVAPDGTATAPIVTRGDDQFLGWFDGNDEFDFADPITGDITLTARWRELNRDTHNVAPDYRDDMAGESLPNPDMFVREGYVFAYVTAEIFATQLNWTHPTVLENFGRLPLTAFIPDLRPDEVVTFEVAEAALVHISTGVRTPVALSNLDNHMEIVDNAIIPWISPNLATLVAWDGNIANFSASYELRLFVDGVRIPGYFTLRTTSHHASIFGMN